MTGCPHCGGDVEREFRFCPWCAAPVRRKIVEFFPARAEEHGRALRVSRYSGDEAHVRFSVWDESGRAEAAVSLDDAEAERLARFLDRTRARPRLRTLLETLLG